MKSLPEIEETSSLVEVSVSSLQTAFAIFKENTPSFLLIHGASPLNIFSHNSIELLIVLDTAISIFKYFSISLVGNITLLILSITFFIALNTVFTHHLRPIFHFQYQEVENVLYISTIP